MDGWMDGGAGRGAGARPVRPVHRNVSSLSDDECRRARRGSMPTLQSAGVLPQHNPSNSTSHSAGHALSSLSLSLLNHRPSPGLYTDHSPN